MTETPVTKIHTILRKNLKEVWMPALTDYSDEKIGKLKLIQILGNDLTRMENELTITINLMLKQRAAADLKPVWEDNLRTKAILSTLLDALEDSESGSEQGAKSGSENQISSFLQGEEISENVIASPMASESKV